MFKSWVAQIIELTRISDKANPYFGGMALAALATFAVVKLFAVTGSNRGLASILAIVVMISAAALGWRAGLTGAVTATLVQDFFFIGDRPMTLFIDSDPQYFLIYLGVFIAGVLPARDVPALLPDKSVAPINGADFVAESVKGEADAEKLLSDAAAQNETWRVTAALQKVAQSKEWTGYEAGFVHAIARQALNRDQIEQTSVLSPANDDPYGIDADAGVVSSDSNLVRLPMRDEQIPFHVNAKN